jgi:hypothetical protein
MGKCAVMRCQPSVRRTRYRQQYSRAIVFVTGSPFFVTGCRHRFSVPTPLVMPW